MTTRNIITKIISRIVQEVRNATNELQARTTHVATAITNDVPFVCQFSVAENAEPTLKKELRPIDDPSWQQSGAQSAEQYATWAFVMCGMACTAMAMRYFFGHSPAPVELAEDALHHGVYRKTGEEISDMRYREFSKWVVKHHLSATVFTRMSVRGIHYALSRGSLFIASVNPNIRGFATAPLSQQGGHLVLITGYDTKQRTVTINNPSGFTSTHTQQRHVIAIDDFLRFYAGRGIVVSMV